jgi:hypothetical protein
MSKKEIPLKEIEEVPESFNQRGKRTRKSK